MVLFRLLERMVPRGCMRLAVDQRGFYPAGGGQVTVDVTPAPQVQGLELLDRGVIRAVRGIVYAGGPGRKAAKDVAQQLRASLRQELGAAVPIDITVDAEAGKSKKPKPSAPASGDDAPLTSRQRRELSMEVRANKSGACGCLLVIETSTGCLIPGDSLCEGTEIHAQEVSTKAVARLLEAWRSGGAVCEV